MLGSYTALLWFSMWHVYQLNTRPEWGGTEKRISTCIASPPQVKQTNQGGAKLLECL